MIRFFGVGRSTVERGDVLRVFALIEETARASSEIKADRPTLLVSGVAREKLSWLCTVSDAPGVTLEAFGLEIDTGGWSTGSYELELHLGAFDAALGEALWILDRSEYQALRLEELGGVEANSVPLKDEEAGALRPDQLTRILRSSFADKLTGFLCVRGVLVPQPEPNISFEGTAPFSGDPLAYIADVFADQCRDLLLFGAADVKLGVTLNADLYRFGLSVRFERALSPLLQQRFTSSRADLPSVMELLGTRLKAAQLSFGLDVGDNGMLVDAAVEVKAIHYATVSG